MARKQVGDLPEAQLQAAARQINTFVRGPRAPRTNAATKLSDALSGFAKKLEQREVRQEQMNVKQATANKLYGGTLFSSTVGEATAAYETNKNSFKTVDEAAEFFIKSTTPEELFQDAHQAAGFREAQAKALGKFRGAHAQYLEGARRSALTRDVVNDFVLTSKTTGVDDAFGRLKTAAGNFDMTLEEADKVPLGVAEIFISQGRFEEARKILENKRGGAGSLVDRTTTAVEANKLMSKIQTEDTIVVANSIKNLEDATEAFAAYTPQQLTTLDALLEKGHLTVAKRNSMLHANEENVRIDTLGDSLAGNISAPDKTFFDALPGASVEDAEKARERFTTKFYNDVESKRAAGTISPDAYSKRVVRFSERTNTTNPAVQGRLGAGFSAFSPNDVVKDGAVSNQTVDSVVEYMTLYRQNANVASAHVSGADQADFYDAITMDVTLGSLPGTDEEKIQAALKNFATDATNPLKTTTNIAISDDDIESAFNKATAKNEGTFNPFDDKPLIRRAQATNGQQWYPYIKRQVQDAARRTGGLNKTQLVNHVVTQIVKRSERIGDYLVPRGTNTIITNNTDLELMSENAVSRYIAENPRDGYEFDELVLVPVVGQQDLWGVAVKGSNMLLETIPQSELPTSGVARQPVVIDTTAETVIGGEEQAFPLKARVKDPEASQILKDEGAVRNARKEHVAYLDTLDKATGGVGHLLTAAERKKYPTGTPIPQAVVDEWLATDLATADKDVTAIFGDIKNPEATQVLKNMAFNLGRTRLNKFTNLKKSVKDGNFAQAAEDMKDSVWFKQTGNRSKRLVARMRAIK